MIPALNPSRSAMFAKTLMNFLLPDRFRRETDGSVSVELVIVVPILFWALAATVVFYDGFRDRYQAQMAAQTVADIMSRETDLFDAAYVEGMNDVFDVLLDGRYPSRIRVSSIIWDSTNQRNMLQWSYGTRGMSGLPTDTFELMQAGDLTTLQALFGNDTSFSFAGAAAQMPVSDLPSRIPPVLPGEALLVVETFALWSPFANVGLGEMRFNPVVVVRPRFAPWINFEGVDPIFPEAAYEVAWTSDDTGLPDPDGGGGTDPDPDPDAGTSFSFDTGVTTGWTSSTTTSGSAGGGGFLGPFGSETLQTPVRLAVDLGTAPAQATIRFDLMLFDTWDGFDPANQRGDTITLLIDDMPITMDAFTSAASGVYGNRRTASGYVGGAAYQLVMVPEITGQNFYGGSARDQLWAVELTLTDAPAQFRLGFSATTNGAIRDESFGLDNVSITATGAAGAAQYSPDPNALVGYDTLTGFARYSGCPDYRAPAPWLTMTASDLQSSAVSVLRNAGGPQNIRNCPDTGGRRYAGGSPNLVLNYVGQTGQVGTPDLVIRTDDGNNGYSCDTTLIMRDPSGQWWFNDDVSGWNAGLTVRNPQTGPYVIFVGTYGRAECQSRLIVGSNGRS